MRRLAAYTVGAAALTALAVGSVQAADEPKSGNMLADGKLLLDMRARYEQVDDANCIACAGRDAQAFTLRARIGYETGDWLGFKALLEIDQIWSLGEENYNSTRNGVLARPTVSDPEQTRLNRLQVS